MKWGSMKLFALLLSLLLNAGILWLGISFYQAQQLALSQVAGSQNRMDFTLEIVSSQHRNPLPESAQSSLAKETNQISSTADSALVPVIASAAESAIKIEPEIEHDIQQDIQQKTLMSEKHDSSVVPEGGSEAIKPISKNHSQADNREKTVDNSHNKPVEVSQSAANVVARSGDQFATELAAKIHAQIQGCYPESSKRRGEEGVVNLKVVKNKDRLSVVMVESSGFKRLDRCAISAVEKLLRLMKVEEVPASGINLKPIRFQLR